MDLFSCITVARYICRIQTDLYMLLCINSSHFYIFEMMKESVFFKKSPEIPKNCIASELHIFYLYQTKKMKVIFND